MQALQHLALDDRVAFVQLLERLGAQLRDLIELVLELGHVAPGKVLNFAVPWVLAGLEGGLGLLLGDLSGQMLDLLLKVLNAGAQHLAPQLEGFDIVFRGRGHAGTLGLDVTGVDAMASHRPWAGVCQLRGGRWWR